MHEITALRVYTHQLSATALIRSATGVYYVIPSRYVSRTMWPRATRIPPAVLTPGRETRKPSVEILNMAVRTFWASRRWAAGILAGLYYCGPLRIQYVSLYPSASLRQSQHNRANRGMDP